jgi:hypothetical protein
MPHSTSPFSRQESLDRIQANVEKLLEEQAYQRAKLEEVHTRTADLPVMIVDNHNLRRRVFHLGGGVAGLVVLHVAQWWETIRKLWE